MTTNHELERPDADKCGENDCFICYPPAEDEEHGQDVELEGHALIKVAGHGTLLRAMPSGAKDASD